MKKTIKQFVKVRGKKDVYKPNPKLDPNYVTPEEREMAKRVERKGWRN